MSRKFYVRLSPCRPPDKGGGAKRRGVFAFGKTPRSPAAPDPLVRGSAIAQTRYVRRFETTVVALPLALGACATIPPPTEEVAAARAMVTQAQPVAAKDAPRELARAQEKLRGAEEAMQRGDNVGARILAEQAEVDAKYAWTIAENAKAQRAAAEVDKSIELLKTELERRDR